MKTKGGRVEIEINGARYSARGEVNVMPNRISMAPGVNRDGSGYQTITPELASLECTFDRGGPVDANGVPLIIDDDLLRSEVNVSVVEIDTGVVHQFTQAGFADRPTLNTENGEVSGLSIRSDQYSNNAL